MKKIEFLEQGLENFCNHIEPVVLDFTKDSITMIIGPNGIGKTTCFQAMPFTLYGQCEKGRGDDVLNNKTGKNCHTWTIFKINDDKYRVDRYVKYTRIGNSVTITKGDSNVPYLKGHKEVLPEIEKLLMPYKLFMNTLLFSQKVKSFFTDLGDADQKEIFRKILTLDDFVLYVKECGDELKEIEQAILNLNQDIGINKGIIENEGLRLKQNQDNKITFNKNREDKIKESSTQIGIQEEKILSHISKQKDLPKDTSEEKQTVSNKISVLRNTLSNLDIEQSGKIENLNNQANLKISELQTKSLELSNTSTSEMNKKITTEREVYDVKFKKAEEQINLIKAKLSELGIESTKHTSNVSYIEKEIIGLDMTNVSTCPTCLREVDDLCINHLKKSVEEKQAEVSFLRDKITEIALECKDLVTKETSWNAINQKDYDKCQKSIKALQEENRLAIAQFVERKNIAINKVKTMIKSGSENIQKETIKNSKNIQQELKDLNLNYNKLLETQTLIEKYNKDLIDLQSFLETQKSELKQTEELVYDESTIISCNDAIENSKNNIKQSLSERVAYDQRLDIIKFWKTGFSSSGIQSMLIDEAIPFMNDRISYYMDMLCNGRYKVTFDTLKATKSNKEFRDKISVDVFDTLTHSDKRVKFSGGQTRLVDIGTILTLADLMANVQDTSVNIILFDEIFDSLDSENIRHASNLLRKAAKNKWVGIISHTKIDDIEADNILEFR